MTRALTLSAKATRELEAVADDVVAGRLQRALERLANMLGWRHVPDLKRAKRDELATARLKIERLERMLREAQAHAERVVSTAAVTIDTRVRPIPKPQKRVVDRDSLSGFREQFPTCAVRGCGLDADPHHLVKRSEGGSDAHENLLALCLHHHTGREGWHTLTPDVWVPKYSARLGVVERCKIRLALETVAARKTLRDACDAEGM